LASIWNQPHLASHAATPLSEVQEIRVFNRRGFSWIFNLHGFSIVFAAFLLRFNRGVHAWQGAWPLSCGQDFVKRGQIAATHRNFSRSESYEIKIDKHFPGVEHWELRLKS
jgi:hypothetical protein